MLLGEVLEGLADELWVVVRYYGMRCLEMAYNVPLDELDQVLGLDMGI